MASPRASVEGPATEVREAKEGLSVTTLIIAAVSSATAAIVVSHLWEKGTIAASAMTPVVVAIVSDLLKKPVESERLRSGVQSLPSLSRPASGRTPRVMAPPGRTKPGADDVRERDDATDPGPVRVYSSGSNKRPRAWSQSGPRRRLRVKVAVITGLVAFLIAAAALTLPELVFGESVGGGGKTTIFGGGGSKDKKGAGDEDGSEDGQSDDPSRQDQPDQQDPEAPAIPDDGSSDDPGTEEPAPTPEEPTAPTPTTPPEAPSQPAPGSTSP